jgi:hypothetical protein
MELVGGGEGWAGEGEVQCHPPCIEAEKAVSGYIYVYIEACECDVRPHKSTHPYYPTQKPNPTHHAAMLFASLFLTTSVLASPLSLIPRENDKSVPNVVRSTWDGQCFYPTADETFVSLILKPKKKEHNQLRYSRRFQAESNRTSTPISANGIKSLEQSHLLQPVAAVSVPSIRSITMALFGCQTSVKLKVKSSIL